jgi:hypothetical protein
MKSKIAALTRIAVGVAAGGCLAASVQAAPVAVVSPPPLDAGFVVQWAEAGTTPHTIAAAEAILAAPTNTATQVLSVIKVNDASVPLVGSDQFAVRATGYVRLAAGNYSFSVTHDDGARLIIGGESAVVFDSDTSTVTTTSPTYALAAGLYTVDLLSWEQGGAFDLELTASFNGGQSQFLEGLHAASTGNVPEPATLALVLASLGGLALSRRRG